MNARLLPLLVLTSATAFAGEPPSLAEIANVPAATSHWRIGAGYAQMLGLKTEFSGLGTFQSPFTLQPLGGGIDYDYDDGHVHVDSSGNAGGETWNWSYDNDSQYNPAGTGSIDYSITNSLANGRAEEDGGTNPGAEIFAYYDMGDAGFNGANGHRATWGFRAGLQYSRINASNSDLITTALSTTTDSFDLGGTIPPQAPYTGSFNGPGPLIGDSPTRTATDGTGFVSGKRELDVDLTVLNLGTYLEIPVAQRLDVLIEGGVSLGMASGDYQFNSATTVGGLSTQLSNGSDSRTDFLSGVYLGVSAIYKLNEDWSIQGSGRYQYMQSFEMSTGGSQASLSFDSAFVLSLSGIYSF